MNIYAKLVNMNQDDVEYYTEGECHTFAVALAEFLNISNPKFLIFGNEDLNEILHVSLLVDDIAYDIRGGVHTNEALNSFCDFLYVMSEDYIEEELFLDDLEKFHKNNYPLSSLNREEIDRAKDIIESYYIPSFSINHTPL